MSNWSQRAPSRAEAPLELAAGWCDPSPPQSPPNRVAVRPRRPHAGFPQGSTFDHRTTIDRIVKEAAPSMPPAGATLPREACHAGRRSRRFYVAAHNSDRLSITKPQGRDVATSVFQAASIMIASQKPRSTPYPGISTIFPIP